MQLSHRTVKDSLGREHGMGVLNTSQARLGARPPCVCGAWLILESVQGDEWRYYCGDGIRFLPAPGLAYGSHMINIDT